MLLRRVLVVFALAMLGLGCRQTSPWEPAVRFDDGVTQYVGYDTDADGRVDYLHGLRDGRKVRFFHDADGDGRLTLMADRSPGTRPGGKHLWVLMEGVPHELVDELWQAGRFRLFYRAGTVIAPLAIRPLSAIKDVVAPGTQPRSAWSDRVHLQSPASYSPFRPFEEPDFEPVIAAFSSGADAQIVKVTHTAGMSRKNLESYLTALDRHFEQITLDSGAAIEITVVGASGNDLADSRRFGRNPYAGFTHMPLPPPFGSYVQGCADPPAEAERLRKLEAVDLVLYREGDGVVVLGADTKAMIKHDNGKFAYRMLRGDPLGLEKAVTDMTVLRQLDKKGFGPAKLWRDATLGHRYPDALSRIWRALAGRDPHEPVMLVNLKVGYHSGDEVTAFGIRGGLQRERSLGFIMSTAFESPASIRADHVLPYMRAFVKPFPDDAASQPTLRRMESPLP